MSKEQTITDLPPGAPIPSSVPPPSAPPKKPPVAALLAAAPSNIDAFLAHLHRCLQTPSGIDTVLLFVCFSSRLTASLVEHVSGSTLLRSLRRAVAVLLAIPPAVVAKSAAARGPTQLPASLRALAATVAEARVFLRLWGLLGMYFWGKRLVLREQDLARKRQQGIKQDPEAALDRAIAWTQLTACVAFQVLENVSFLGRKEVLPIKPATLVRASRWSTRFWAVHIGLELGRLLVEGSRRVVEGKSDDQVWAEGWKRAFVRNLAWAPLTVHWSMEKGFVNETMIGAIATVPGVIQMTQLWKDTAK